jgi:hypothetical protein
LMNFFFRKRLIDILGAGGKKYCQKADEE